MYQDDHRVRTNNDEVEGSIGQKWERDNRFLVVGLVW